MIKKTILLASLIWTISSGPAMATQSVWGIPAGSDFNLVKSNLESRGCSLKMDMSSLESGKSREAFFDGVFFDRPCVVRTIFRDNSLSSFQFFFLKKADPSSGDVGDMLGNYSELTLKLRSKYGYDREITSHVGGETQRWTVEGVKITLSCDNRSSSGHTTSLIYDFL